MVTGFISKSTITLLFLASFQTLPANSIVGSKHDLSASNYYGYDGTATTEICVFCHTPHGASNTIAPLWNRKVTDTSAYTLYGGASGVPNLPSLACLSCHDGVSSIGGDASAVSAYDGHTLLNPPNGSVTDPNCTACHRPGGAMPSELWRIGADLRDDHPLSVVYNAGVANLRPTDTGLNTATGSVVPWTVGGKEWISDEKTIADLLRNSRIECVSCHDPHLGDNATFLRTPDNAESKLCLTCHSK